MVDHCASGRCATWFAGWEKTLESAETITTAHEMPISQLAGFISATTSLNTEFEAIVAIFRASRKGRFVLVAGRLQSEPNLALSAPRIWAYFPRSGVLERMTIGCLTLARSPDRTLEQKCGARYRSFASNLSGTGLAGGERWQTRFNG